MIETMNYFIFDFTKDISLIDSFLTSASLAHNQDKKTKEWFLWKFKDNPFGESILACAKENGIIAGCVAFGMQDFVFHSKIIKGAMSFETFVHPDYQGKGLFKRLINIAETEAKRRGIKLLLNFPNSNSLTGFLKSGWVQINNTEYWIKPNNIIDITINFKNLRRGFKPNEANLDQLDKNSFNRYKQNIESGLFSKIDIDYLKWRFLLFPNAEYIILNDTNCYSIGRVGKRGKLTEIQVLFVTPKENNNFSLKNVLKAYRRKFRYDLISFPISQNNRLKPALKRNLFFKVPNSTNVCYKILDESLNLGMNQIELSTLNFHTY